MPPSARIGVALISVRRLRPSGTESRTSSARTVSPVPSNCTPAASRPATHDRTTGWSAAIVRDLWIADLLARDAGPAADGERPEPEEPFLTALMDHWHVDIAALRTPPESTWLWSDLHLSDRTVLEA